MSETQAPQTTNPVGYRMATEAENEEVRQHLREGIAVAMAVRGRHEAIARRVTDSPAFKEMVRRHAKTR